MPSDEPISLTTAMTIAAIAAVTAAGTGIYVATKPPPGPDIPTGPPEPPKLPEFPKITAPEQAADITQPIATGAETNRAAQAALALRRRQGRASTLLTGPSGLYSNTATASPVKTFLGT